MSSAFVVSLNPNAGAGAGAMTMAGARPSRGEGPFDALSLPLVVLVLLFAFGIGMSPTCYTAHAYHSGEGEESSAAMADIPDDLEVEVKVGVLGLKPKGEQSVIGKKCDKVLYEQVALRIALDHIESENGTIIDLSSVIPARVRTDPKYVGDSTREVVANVTRWARSNIEACAMHEVLFDIETTSAVMFHAEDTVPNTVDMILGPRDAANHQCRLLREVASLGRLPMVTWGCTNVELGMAVGERANTTTISMLPENAENLEAHALLDFLHDHSWDQGHVAVVYAESNTESTELVRRLNMIKSCGNQPHDVTVHAFGLPKESRDGPLNLNATTRVLNMIKEGDHNILVSALDFMDLPLVLYEAYQLGMVGKDNIWIYANDFTPGQLEVASKAPLGLLLEGMIEVDPSDSQRRLGELMHGSFSMGWTPGGASYTTSSNPWNRFKKMWSEQTPDQYPDLGLPDDFFKYAPLSANAAMVYDSAWIGLVSYLHRIINSDSLVHDHGHDDHQGEIVGTDEIHLHEDSVHVTGNSSNGPVSSHMHVCATSESIPGALSFDGVTGPVMIDRYTKARAPVAKLISAVNLQWRQETSELSPYTYGSWPYIWDEGWRNLCSMPAFSLWETLSDMRALKYGSSETPPKHRSIYTSVEDMEEEKADNKKHMSIIIGVLVGTLALLAVVTIFLFYRYRTVHKKVIRNEKVAKDFQFEWETNAGRALTTLNSMIETMNEGGDRSSRNKATFENKLSEIRMYLLAQDARVEMNEVQHSIQRVGEKRYTPEVTAYLMEHALNAGLRTSEENCVYRRSNSFEKRIDKTSMRSVLEKSLGGSITSEESIETGKAAAEESVAEKIKRRLSTSTDTLNVISPVVDKVLVEQVKEKVIATLNMAANGDRNFDVFELAELTGDRPLSTLSLFLLHRRGVCSALRLDQNKLIAYVVEVENNMFDHPYHNRRHVADVVAGIYAFTVPGGCLYDFVQASPLTMLAVVFAATVHDLQHPGVSNAYLCKTLHPLAVKHSDKSVNESHHLSCAFDLMAQDNFNFVQGSIDMEDFLTFRSLVIEMVLATDMKSHFSILDKFKRFQKAREADPESLDIQSEMNNVFAIAIKVADLIHCSRPLKVHHQWVDCITTEFFNQGDLERAKNMQLSPGMDRNQPSGPLQQVGFTEIFALPLYKAWREYATTCGSQGGKKESQFYDGVNENYSYWLHASKTPATEEAAV